MEHQEARAVKLLIDDNEYGPYRLAESVAGSGGSPADDVISVRPPLGKPGTGNAQRDAENGTATAFQFAVPSRRCSDGGRERSLS